MGEVLTYGDPSPSQHRSLEIPLLGVTFIQSSSSLRGYCQFVVRCVDVRCAVFIRGLTIWLLMAFEASRSVEGHKTESRECQRVD